MKDEQAQQEPQSQPQPQPMTIPPGLAAQIKAQMEAQAVEKSVTEEINMLLQSRGCVIHISMNLDSQFGLQPSWRVVKLK